MSYINYNKKLMVSHLIETNKLFEKNISEDTFKNILEIIFNGNLTIYKKKVLNNIINSILYKKNINKNEEKIILSIIENINEKKNKKNKKNNESNNIIYYDIIINIIDTIYLRKLSEGSLKYNILNDIIKKFNDINNYIIISEFNNYYKNRESKIKVFIYKVYHTKENFNNGPSNKDIQYSFKHGIKKIKNNNYNYIKPNNPNNLSNTDNLNNINHAKIYSKDIITSRKNNNNIKNLFNNNSNISILYSLYKNIPSRIEINEFSLNIEYTTKIYNLINNLILTSIAMMENYFINNINNINNIPIKDDHEIIYNIVVPNNTKIIVMGDQHGSLHSFFRIFIRLISMGIINKDFKLKKNYKIIFLGDIIDRGYFGIEIMYIILKLITINNTKSSDLSNINVILNRGNHEEFDMFNVNGFSKEIKKKFGNKSKQQIIDKFINLYKFCPSAIILKHKNIKYWLCHGGFDIADASKEFNIGDNKCINREIKNMSQIRWNDFTIETENSPSIRDKQQGTVFNIGLKTLHTFLKINKINFIIRGHTDNYNNAMLLIKKKDSNYNTEDYNNWFFLNKKFCRDLYMKSNTNLKYNQILNYENIIHKGNDEICEKEIVTINPQTELFNPNISTNNNNEFILYPVLTISNNSDIGRYQYDDSYIIIE